MNAKVKTNSKNSIKNSIKAQHIFYYPLVMMIFIDKVINFDYSAQRDQIYL